MRNCEYCGQRVERVIRVGDLVQCKFTRAVGLVAWVIESNHTLDIRILGNRGGGFATWLREDVDLIHGTLRITERL